MSHRHTYATIVVVGVLTAALDLLMHLIPDSPGAKPWLEHQHWYSAKSLLLAVACLVVAIIAVELWRHRSAGAAEKTAQDSRVPLDRVLRLRLLDKIQKERVEPRLHQGLREAIRVDLGLTEIPGAVQPRLRVYAVSESAAASERPTKGPIEATFKQAGGRLLILGEPGTGKTNLLLELADSLIKNAKRDEALPIPVVFNLPRWTLGKRARTLSEWMKDDLAIEYGLSSATAHALITRNCILPLLDGLDEVSELRRSACIDAICAFQKDRDLGGLVVSCRTAEYASIPKLDLGTAVRVEKLARTDIEHQIARPRLARVKQALKSNPQLWDVIDTPLWLHVLYIAVQVELSPRDPAMANPSDWLYSRYLEYALGRTADNSPRKRSDRRLLVHWLSSLARDMRLRGQSQFAFEDLDFSWLSSRLGRRTGRACFALSYGLVLALQLGLLMGFSLGLRRGLLGGLFGLTVGLLAGVGEGFVRVEAMEELEFTRREAYPQIVRLVAAFGLFAGLLGGLEGLVTNRQWVLGVVVGLIVGPAIGLVIGLDEMLKPRPISKRIAPNRGTLRSLHYAMAIGMTGLASAVVLHLILSHISTSAGGVYATLVATWTVSMFVFLLASNKGGSFALRHYTVRLFLWCFCCAPLRYPAFLNEAAERLLLIRRGGSYEFFHQSFRDYMANATLSPKDAGLR